MKFFFSAYVLFCLPALGFSQNWQPFGDVLDEAVYTMFNDTLSGQLYVGGDYYAIDNDSNMRAIAIWDGNQWQSMATGLDSYQWPASLRAIIRYNNEIYVGGYLTNANNGITCNGIARWDGTVWKEVAGGVLSDGSAGIVESFSVINDELYVSGAFTSVGGITVNGLAKWNGTSWSAVHNFPLFNDPDGDFIFASIVYENELYIAGTFYDNTGRIGITKWDGNTWVSVGNGVGIIFKLIVYKNKLYTAGSFSKNMNPAFPGYHIAAWDGNNWNDVGGGVLGENGVGMGDIYDITIYNDELYAVGAFVSAGGIQAEHIAKWNGTEWCGLGSTFNSNILSVQFYEDTLFIGGGFTLVDGGQIKAIAKWIGGDYVDTCGNLIGIDDPQVNNQYLQLYPNPATNNLIIETGNYTKSNYSIYDITGRLLHTGSISPKTSIDVSDFADGLYVVQLQTGQGMVSRRFIKQ